ncbi:TPR-like protein [Hanseniaspora valbyensis NRRL Y-1626]|uniref:TPR-like protein n=1 Tax=Hanseniaspora valbyensis NRRL Y-1626 TaxID=766949 RepID=A0A1B7TAF0_9ASCO|nr:TPR-like protein [Hanseniaspora valbyensis NRRL Y-1626]
MTETEDNIQMSKTNGEVFDERLFDTNNENNNKQTKIALNNDSQEEGDEDLSDISSDSITSSSFSSSSSSSSSSDVELNHYNEEFGNIDPEEFDLLAEFTDDEEFENRQKNMLKINSKKRKLSQLDSKDNNELNSNDDEVNRDSEEDEDDDSLDAVNEEEDFIDAMREANNFKPRRNKNKLKSKDKKKKKKGGAGGYKKLAAKINPELSALMARANEAYVSMNLPLAEELFSEIIKKDSNRFSAYKTLGDIYQQQNRLNDCCNIWMLGAHLNPSDYGFWKDVAMLSLNLNHISQALYCFNKVLQLNSNDDESLFERSKLCSITGQVSKALDGFNKLFTKYSFDQSIVTEYVTLLNKTGKQEKAVNIYKDVFKKNVAKRQFLTKFREHALDSEEEQEEDDDEDDIYDDDDDEIEIEGDFAGVPLRKVEKYQCMPFDWSDLNIMIDLMLDMPVSKQNEPKKNITIIKEIARFIEFRESQVFWNTLNNNNNDVEFDDRREFVEAYQNLSQEEQTQKDYSLPIDIRIRLGILRLKNKQADEAKLHFHFLLEEEVPQDFYDLFFVAGKNLTDNDQYEEAIIYLEPLLKDPTFENDLTFFKKIGKCYKMLEKYDLALPCFEKILELQPEQLDNKLNLAEIYHYVGRIDEYKALLEEVINERKQIEDKNATRTRAKAQKNRDNSVSNTKTNSPDLISESITPSFTPNIIQDNSKTNNPLMETTIKVKKNSTPTQPISKQEREERIKTNVIEKFSKLSLYKQDSMILWQDTVSDLLNIFTSVRNLFLKRRSGQFEGVISRSRRFDKLLDYKIEKISLLENDNDSNSALPMIKEEKVELVDENGVRGLDYDTWFKLFMEFVFVIAKERGTTEGLELLDTAEDINIFYGNESRSRYMKFIRFAIEDDSSKWELVKNLINAYQFNRKVYSLVLLVLQDGTKKSFDNICHKNLQKLILRTIKTFDSFRFNKKIVGSAALINDKLENNKKMLPSPYLYYLFGICFFSSKTYGASLQYFLKIDLILNEDPMLKYMIGVSYLNKAMQRQTTLRNYYMLHAFKYLNQYKHLQIKRFGENSQEHMESEYNLGKVYQMLGLNTLAMKHYWKVLSSDLNSVFKKHAAFNLVNLYINSNNFEKADIITKKFLQVD